MSEVTKFIIEWMGEVTDFVPVIVCACFTQSLLFFLGDFNELSSNNRFLLKKNWPCHEARVVPPLMVFATRAFQE